MLSLTWTLTLMETLGTWGQQVRGGVLLDPARVKMVAQLPRAVVTTYHTLRGFEQ